MSNLFDTSTAPTTEPTEIIAGDFTRWRRTDLAADYPTAEYDLIYECRAEGTLAGMQISLAATIDAGDYLVQIPSVDSANYKPAVYHWFAYMVRKSDDERVQVDCGIFEVKPDRALDATDPAAFARRMLVKIEEAIEGRATNFQIDTLSHDLGGDIQIARDPSKLLEWRMHFRREVRRINQRINAKKGKCHGGIVKVSF